MTARFAGKIALVTGAGSGIGRESALAFAREGATVVATGRSPEGLKETVRILQEEGGAGEAVTLDVSDHDEVAAVIASVAERHGRLDIAHNNAGMFVRPTQLADLGKETWDAVIRVNLTGTMLCMKYEIQQMRAQGGGVIVNTASNIGYHGRRPGLAAYATSKAAVSTLTRAAALDHIADGVRINAVSPGATRTAMSLRPGETDDDRAERLRAAVPAGRVAEVSEVVNAVLWLASDDSSFVVGQDLVIDGGVTA